MKKSTRWGLIIGVVCGAEVVGVVLIGAAGLASIFSPDNVVAIGLAVGLIMIAVLLWSRRKGKTGMKTS